MAATTRARRAALMLTAAATATTGVAAFAPSASAASTSVVRKATGSVNLRAAASTSSATRGTLGAGVVINGTLSNGWLHITSPKAYAGAYVSDSVLVYGGAKAPSKPACGSQDRTGGGYVLCRDYVGVKAYTTRQKLGLRVTHDVKGSTLGADAITALEKFQGDHELPVTGEVDRATFAALGGGNFDMDAWVNPASSSSDHIGAMISWATAQRNKPYIWGGLGQVGYDCSGLVLQAVRAGGLKPTGVSNLTDIRPASDLSRQMWADTREFPHVSDLTSTSLKATLSKAKRGDIVFYADSSKTVRHVGIFAGNNTVIDAVDGLVRVETAPQAWGRVYFGLARPFN